MTVRYLGMNCKTGLNISNVDNIRQSVEEAPLEAPLFDRTDLASIAFGAFRLFRAGKAILESGVKTAVTMKLSEATVSLLCGRLKCIYLHEPSRWQQPSLNIY